MTIVLFLLVHSMHVRQARLSVRVLSGFMAKERILNLTAMGFFLNLRRQGDEMLGRAYHSNILESNVIG